MNGLRPDLVLCSGTLPSDTTFPDRVAAANAAGYSAISLWGRDYAGARADGLTDADIRALLADYGLVVAELDPAWWWLPGAADVQIPAHLDTQQVFQFGEDALFAIADAVGARSVNAVDVFGGEWNTDAAAEALASLGDRAAEHGLLVHLEFLPWSKIPDVATAWEVVRRADRANCGIAIDAWHYFRSDADEKTLRTIPGDRVLGIQLDDAPAAAEANLMHATLHERLVPGAGDLDLAALMGALRDIGAIAPIGVEVFSDALHALRPHDAARHAAEATRAVLAAAGES